MNMRTTPKTPYEIRLELLQLAQLILNGKHAANAAAANSTRPAATTAPTTEEIITEAEKMNAFISKANLSH
jgi:hypothetical protein